MDIFGMAGNLDEVLVEFIMIWIFYQIRICNNWNCRKQESPTPLFNQKALSRKLNNIARGTSDPGHNSSYASNAYVRFYLHQLQIWPRWFHLHGLKIWPPGGATGIGGKFGDKMKPLASVANLANWISRKFGHQVAAHWHLTYPTLPSIYLWQRIG